MVHVNRAWEAQVTQDSFICDTISNTKCCTLTVHGSHTLLRSFTVYRSHTVIQIPSQQFSQVAISLLVWSSPPHDMNVFMTYLTVDHVVTHVQGYSSVFLMILCKKLCMKCEGIWSNLWLLYISQLSSG